MKIRTMRTGRRACGAERTGDHQGHEIGVNDRLLTCKRDEIPSLNFSTSWFVSEMTSTRSTTAVEDEGEAAESVSAEEEEEG